MASKVFEKLMKVQYKLRAPKDCENKFGGYKYRKAEDILEAVKPLLMEVYATVRIDDEIVQVGERYYVRSVASFYDCESGDEVSARAFAREPLDRKGMDAAQVTGASSSYARKYALNGLFAIDDSDSDPDVTNRHGKAEPEPEKKPEAKKPAPAPASPADPKPEAKKKASLISQLGKDAWGRYRECAAAWHLSDAQRSASWTEMLMRVVGKASAQDITDAEWVTVRAEVERLWDMKKKEAK